MLHALLPFFLAVSIPSGNGPWKFGPEYKFSARARMISALERDEGVLLGNDMKVDLKCQPSQVKALNGSLICRFENSVIGKLQPNSYDASGNETSDEYKKMGFMKEMFGVRFNEKGIESYVIEKTDPPLPAWCLDMTRLIFNQLSIGARIADEFTPQFRVSENFTFGECAVNYIVERKPTSEETTPNSKRAFELVALENLGDFHDETIEIEKIRDVDDCLVCADYFYGSRYTYGVVYRDVLTKVKSSTSRISISKNELRAETVNEVELFGQDRKRQGDVLDHMEIKLVSVSAAREKFRALKNPVDMEVVANRPGSPHVQ